MLFQHLRVSTVADDSLPFALLDGDWTSSDLTPVNLCCYPVFAASSAGAGDNHGRQDHRPPLYQLSDSESSSGRRYLLCRRWLKDIDEDGALSNSLLTLNFADCRMVSRRLRGLYAGKDKGGWQ